jgi:hypothetical protein
MKFQAANDLNIPFFVSWGARLSSASYNSGYLDSVFDPYKIPNPDSASTQKYVVPLLKDFSIKENTEIDVLGGFQIKINSMFYIPIFVQYGLKIATTLIEEWDAGKENKFLGSTGIGGEYWLNADRKGPGVASSLNHTLFAGSGLFINTKKIKGGIYLGYAFIADGEEIQIVYSYENGTQKNVETFDIDDYTNWYPGSFKIALVPIVPTSEWALVGKALESIFGYFGLNDVLYKPDVDKEDSKLAAYAKTINAALDLSFNKINWGAFDLNLNALYTRGKFDVAAKADTFGLKAAGAFTNFPFGFTLEGGWKHFYDVSPSFGQDYTDGAYFTGSIFFPFKKWTPGFIYEYNNIYGSTYTIAISMRSFKYFFGISPDTRDAGNGKFESDTTLLSMRGGIRYWHGAWKAGRE